MKLSTVIAIFFTSLLLLQTSGRWLVFKLSEWEIEWKIQIRIRQNPSAEELSIIAVHSTEKQLLEWMEPHEFRLDGMMYDIVREETKGDSIYYYCLADHKEATLLAKWEKSMEEEHQPLSSSQGKWSRLLELLSSSYLKNGSPLFSTPMKCTAQALFDYTFSVQPWQLVPPFPPPKQGLLS